MFRRRTTGRGARRQLGSSGVLRGRLVAADPVLSGAVQLIPRTRVAARRPHAPPRPARRCPRRRAAIQSCSHRRRPPSSATDGREKCKKKDEKKNEKRKTTSSIHSIGRFRRPRTEARNQKDKKQNKTITHATRSLRSLAREARGWKKRTTDAGRQTLVST